jgi:hypothetical protein
MRRDPGRRRKNLHLQELVVGRPLRRIHAAGLVLGLVLPGALAAASPQSPHLWGRVTLVDGDVLEGFVRWDRNETTVADLLDGNRMPTDVGLRLRRELSERTAEDRRRSVELPGVRVTWVEADDLETRVQAAIRFGWIQRIVPDGSEARVELRGGGSVDLQASSTDLGPSFRGLEVEVGAGDVRDVAWSRIRDVRFLPVPEGSSPGRARLFGTVTTERGLSFTGWIAWDADEVFASEMLEGDEGRVAFEDIRMIERARRGVVVTLASGDQRTLTGTHDVAGANRGIDVSDPALGRVVVSWDAFESLHLHDSAGAPTGSRMPDAPGPLLGAVETESGRVLEGRIVWDLDEHGAWHILDGDADGVEVDIEFSRIARIEKARGGEGVIVTLLDGRTLDLKGSNDVDASNRGIVVMVDGGDEEFVEWAGFRSLALEWR